MKVRKGFVTNSSSSSFIVITNENAKADNKLLKIFLDYINNQICDRADSRLKNEQEIMDYIMIKYDLQDELPVLTNDNTREEYKELISYLEKGFSILLLDSISDSSSLYDLLIDISIQDNDYIIVKNIY